MESMVLRLTRHDVSAPGREFLPLAALLARRLLLWKAMTLTVILASMAGVGLVTMIRELMNAPVGEQTEAGFEIVWTNVDRTREDVSCIWDRDCSMDLAGAHGALLR